MPFGIGPGELVVVLVIMLILVGPGRLPEVGSAVGRSLREFRAASRPDAPPPASPSTAPLPGSQDA